MDSGESSGTKRKLQDVGDDVWAKLVPINSSYPEVDIRLNETTICSSIMCSSTDKSNWCIITRAAEKATIRNISANIIYVNNTPLGVEESVKIQCGSQIVAGSDEKAYVTYFFRAISTKKKDENVCQISLDVDHAKCGICLSVWNDVVTVSPCLHNFCNGCLSDWMKRSRKKSCPQCRATIASVGKNHFMRSIEEVIPKKRKTNQPSVDANENDTEQVSCLDANENDTEQVSCLDANENDTEQVSCIQCDTEFGGFRCDHSTKHLKCEACKGMMPLRPNISVPQHCLGCDRAYCYAYWLSQGVMPSADTPICGNETFLRVCERILSRIPSSAHQGNQYEIEVTESCINRLGKPLHDVIFDFVVKLNNGELDRSRMPLNHAELINGGTFLCNECYDKLVGYLLYWFRITSPNHLLPTEASERDNCWYGYYCRTQRKAEHARRLNHVCRPTKSSTDHPTGGST